MLARDKAEAEGEEEGAKKEESDGTDDDKDEERGGGRTEATNGRPGAMT